MKRRKEVQEKIQLPYTKLRRLVVKQERAVTRGAQEALEGDSTSLVSLDRYILKYTEMNKNCTVIMHLYLYTYYILILTGIGHN